MGQSFFFVLLLCLNHFMGGRRATMYSALLWKRVPCLCGLCCVCCFRFRLPRLLASWRCGVSPPFSRVRARCIAGGFCAACVALALRAPPAHRRLRARCRGGEGGAQWQGSTVLPLAVALFASACTRLQVCVESTHACNTRHRSARSGQQSRCPCRAAPLAPPFVFVPRCSSFVFSRGEPSLGLTW